MAVTAEFLNDPTPRRAYAGEGTIRATAFFSPSPGNPGEGWGEGLSERRERSAIEEALILTFSRYREKGPEELVAIRTDGLIISWF